MVYVLNEFEFIFFFDSKKYEYSLQPSCLNNTKHKQAALGVPPVRLRAQLIFVFSCLAVGKIMNPRKYNESPPHPPKISRQTKPIAKLISSALSCLLVGRLSLRTCLSETTKSMPQCCTSAVTKNGREH
jgi:hypothetical protein